MSLFGIPVFVSKEMIIEFLALNFAEVILEPYQLLYVFLFLNFMYLWFYFKVLIPFLYKVFMYVLNHIF